MTEQKDLSKILVNDTIHEVEIPYKGDVFKFKYKDLSWVQITKIASRCVDYSRKTAVVDRSEFDIQFLEASLIEAPWDLKLTRSIVSKINKDFGKLLREIIIPDPSMSEDEELKNE